MNFPDAKLAIDSRDIIGEGPAWDAAAARVLWSDNPLGLIHEARADGSDGWRETRQWSLQRPIGAAIPRANGGLVVVSGAEVLLLDDAGHSDVLARIDIDPQRLSLNDAKCDALGRLWVGTLATDFSDGQGTLYRVDPSGTVARMADSISLSNGIDWSPDDRTLYFVDSAARCVYAFDFDLAQGTLANRRTLVSIRFGDGAPDGMTVDNEGCLWVAVMPTGQIRRYAPDGKPIGHVQFPVAAVTSCAFGGPLGQELFVTSAAIRLPDVLLKFGFSEDILARSHLAPGTGGLFVCRPGVSGRPANPFGG